MSERTEAKKLMDSRLIKGGAVAALIGAALGIGIAVEVGLLAVGGGAAAHFATRKNNK